MELKALGLGRGVIHKKVGPDFPGETFRVLKEENGRMKHKEGFFKGVREANIYFQSWLPESEPKAGLLIVHGLAEHSGRYMNVVKGPWGQIFILDFVTLHSSFHP
jgi:hypothetical protein